MTDARTSRRRTPAAALAVVVMIAGAVLAGCTSRSDTSATLPSNGSPSWSVASPGELSPAAGSGSGSVSGFVPGASQSAADAARDGVEPAVAALPARARIRQVTAGHGGGQTRASTSEGLWLVSRPGVAAQTAGGYGELLLLDPTGTQIRRAYPFAGLAPHWLLVTPAAIYCGRSGVSAAPDAMVCRVDRTSRQLRVRVFADRLTSPATTPADVTGRPGRWAVDDQRITADFGRPPGLRATELVFTTAAETQPLLLDPDTLQVIGS